MSKPVIKYYRIFVFIKNEDERGKQLASRILQERQIAKPGRFNEILKSELTEQQI